MILTWRQFTAAQRHWALEDSFRGRHVGDQTTLEHTLDAIPWLSRASTKSQRWMVWVGCLDVCMNLSKSPLYGGGINMMGSNLISFLKHAAGFRGWLIFLCWALGIIPSATSYSLPMFGAVGLLCTVLCQKCSLWQVTNLPLTGAVVLCLEICADPRDMLCQLRCAGHRDSKRRDDCGCDCSSSVTAEQVGGYFIQKPSAFRVWCVFRRAPKTLSSGLRFSEHMEKYWSLWLTYCGETLSTW